MISQISLMLILQSRRCFQINNDKNPDLTSIVNKILENRTCMRLTIVTSKKHATDVDGVISFLLEKACETLKQTQKLMDESYREQRQDPIILGIHPLVYKNIEYNFIILYFFNMINVEKLTSIKDYLYFYPLIENLKQLPEVGVLDRLIDLPKLLTDSKIPNPYLVMLFPESMHVYIPDFHVFLEKIILRLQISKLPSVVISKFNKEQILYGLTQNVPFSVIFQNLRVPELLISPF